MMERKHKNIPIFVPHIGCPNDCSFCNQKKITGVKDKISIQKAEEIINEALKTVDENSDVQIAFFGGSFTGIEKDYRIELLTLANKYLSAKKVSGIRLSTRPDYIDEEILDELKEYGVTDIELGVQSLDEDVLIKNRRGHTKEDTIKAAKLIKEKNFRLGLQMMPGLFGDTKEKTLYTANDIIKLAPYCVRIYPTVVIKDTYLAELYEKGEFKPLSIDDAVKVTAELYEKFTENNIKVIRMGLMASGDLADGSEVLAGPFHPSFGELCMSEILFNKAKKQIEGKKGDAKVYVNPKTVSAFVGNKKKNIKRLEEILGAKVAVHQDEKLERNEVRVVVS